ncbi:MAG: MG2 domain-containing protein, partial [Candidatus Eisenbacteria bacterium]|nr:MG2 domain-containing protein [Candidatus Eisenbacteria bacterium]
RLEFTVAPNRVVGLRGAFELVNDGDPRQVILVGTAEFSDSVGMADLRAEARLLMDGAVVPLTWEAGPRAFTFRSGAVPRGDQVRSFSLRLPAAAFALENEFLYTTELRSLSELGIAQVTTGSDEQEPRISVHFIDPLSETQDLAAYIAIEPYLETKVSAVGKTLHITGPFDRETRYTLAVRQGIMSRWNTTLRENYVREIVFGDQPPQLAFLQTGAFLPSKGARTIGFRTVNVRRVRVNVLQVFESNLGQFLQEYDLTSATTRGEFWGDMNRVGVSVAAETLEIGGARNNWVQSTLDLSQLLQKHDKGLFVVELSMGKRDVMYTCADVEGWIPWDSPCSDGYYYSHGTVTKPVVMSDIGLLAKREGDRMLVASTHLGDAKPLPGVKVTLFSYQSQPMEIHLTDAAGVATFDSTGGFFLLGEWNGQRTALKFSESELNFGSFDVGGEAGAAQKTRAFVYTERGVHRPGDPVYLSVIVRDQSGTFPTGSPITMKVLNPKNQLVNEAVNRDGIGGHYGFTFTTSEADPTGNWYAEFYNGRMLLARHRLKIETVVPNRLKVALDMPTDSLGPDDRTSNLRLRSSYLFGAPASGLAATVSARYMSTEKRFSQFADYRFTTPLRRFEADDTEAFDGNLAADGTAGFTWNIPDLSEAPSAVGAVLTARVFEKGGRPATQSYPVLIDPYEAYVGLKEAGARYLKVNAELKLAAVVLDRHGKPLPGREIKVNVYHNARYWWWQYDDDSSTLKFKTDVSTGLAKSFTVVSEQQPVVFGYAPETEGQHFIEVEDVQGGHQSGYFVWASSWGEEAAPMAAGTHLQMESDKAAYRPGDVARITVRTPAEGAMFYSVEKGSRVLSHSWVELTGTTTSLTVEVTRDMLPNAYVTAVVIQPYEHTANDRPMRLFGTIPLSVEEPSTHLSVEVEAPPELKPRQEFTVTARVPRGSKATVTLAVVDEGLLDLTSFKTPDPWAFFFAKERLSVATFDIFDNVIGMLWGDIEKRFTVGGDEDAFRTKQLGPVRAKRFEPVAMFRGPVPVDSQGKASFTFTMPNYMGSVRVMAVASDGNSYGANEAAIPVREPLVLLPTLPRVIGPGETFTLPATVFTLNDSIRDVEISVRTTGPLTVEGPSRQRLTFSGKGEQDALFAMRAGEAAGVATVRVEATAASHTAWVETELAVRPVNPYLYDAREFTVQPGERVDFTLPAMGLEGTRRASVRVAAMPGLRFGSRLARLMRFPYGCVEQTTSAVFPQLFLKDFMAFVGSPQTTRHEVRTQVDHNINHAVDRLRRFQTADGGFAYWPGGLSAAEWATNYAGHFLLEAKALGYFVPSDMIARWLTFEKRLAAGESGDYKTRCYRLYLLAMAGEPSVGAMNLMREERLDLLDTVSKWYLAGAYLRAGMESAAAEVLRNAGTDITEYRETGGTYGSALRDKAILLELATLAGNDALALRLFDEVNTALGGTFYLSTQEGGYSLLAIGKYLKAFWRHDAPVKGS